MGKVRSLLLFFLSFPIRPYPSNPRHPCSILRLTAGRTRVGSLSREQSLFGLVAFAQGVLQRRVMRGPHLQLPFLDLPVALEQAPWRGAGRPLAVGVVDAAVAWAHVQAGLREPRHRTTQV